MTTTPRWTRRAALATVGAGVLAGCGGGGRDAPSPPLSGLFRHGVASGDPLGDRLVLWTRVTTPGDVEVTWRLARDRAMTDVAKSGALRAEAARDHCVKVDVGGLAPGATYYFDFAAGGERSPVGRTRTLPQGAAARFTIAAFSCANHPAGWFNAYRDAAGRAEIDLALHLGDYLYEYGPGEYATAWGMKNGRAPEPPRETVSLADYRTRHAQYKADPDLQALHAHAPCVAIWDDHESADDSWRDGAFNHQEAEGDWASRKAAAMQAYYEWMPVREPAGGRAREAAWRSFEIGDLATLVVLETRLAARAKSIAWDAFPIPADADPSDPANQAKVADFLTKTVGEPGREMLGGDQQAFVAGALARSTAAGKPWQLLANQVILGRVKAPDYIASLPGWLKAYVQMRSAQTWEYFQRTRFNLPMNLDAWDGYPAARARLLAAAHKAKARLLALTGDTHNFWLNRLTTDEGAAVGAELGVSSVTSPSEFEAAPPGVDFGALTQAANRDVLHHNPTDKGYVLLTLTPEAATADYIRMSTIASRRFRAETYKRVRFTPAADGRMTYEDVKV